MARTCKICGCAFQAEASSGLYESLTTEQPCLGVPDGANEADAEVCPACLAPRQTRMQRFLGTPSAHRLRVLLTVLLSALLGLAIWWNIRS